MNSIQSQFICWYFNEFVNDPLFVDMTTCSEASKWHREQTVAIHTNMVVGEYLSTAPAKWRRHDLLGALACAFHDTGKPAARTEKHSEERGTYYSYGGHEILSARLWEDWVARNWTRAVELFDIDVNEVFMVTWMIEHHRPWGLKDVVKRTNLFTTALMTVGVDVYARMLKADNWGRIGDTQTLNRQGVDEWLKQFNNDHIDKVRPGDWISDVKGDIPHKATGYNSGVSPTLHMLIGCSGSGKSTYTDTFSRNTRIYSWDQLRLDWYDDDYLTAFSKSAEDKEFGNRVNVEFTNLVKEHGNVIVDNTNLSAKRRRFFLTEAKRNGYKTVGVTFPTAMDTVLDRQHTRSDKTIPHNAVKSQYMHTQQPQLGEFDEIVVLSNNLGV